MHQGTVNKYQPNPPFELHTDSHTDFCQNCIFSVAMRLVIFVILWQISKVAKRSITSKKHYLQIFALFAKRSINWSKRTFFEFEYPKLPRLWRVQLRIQISTSKKGMFGEPLWLKGKAILYIARFSNRYIIVKVFRKRFGYLVRTYWCCYELHTFSGIAFHSCRVLQNQNGFWTPCVWA